MKRRPMFVRGVKAAILAPLCSAAVLFGTGSAPRTAEAAAAADVTCVPAVTGPVPISEQSQPYRAAFTPPPGRGYVEEEFFISCDALGATYKTTMDVRRPAKARKASGVVVVEPTHSGNLWPVMSTTQPYQEDAGHVSVAVSASPFVVGRFVKPSNPDRYASLTVPEVSGIELEILAQVGALLQRNLPSGPLPDIHVEDVILAGYSATGGVVRDFIDDKRESRIDGRAVYDGYFPGQTAVGTLPEPIPDTDVPVIELQGERELLVTFERNPGGLTYRRPDGTNYRLYEIPAMPHVTTENGESDLVRAECREPVRSSFPLTHYWDMALDNLVVWVTAGLPAPHAQRIELTSDGRSVARDENGNAVGGVPTPYIDVPVATYGATSTNSPNDPPDARCDMVGFQVDFSNERLAALYRNHGGYVHQFDHRLKELVRERWYLPRDARQARVEAARSDVLR